MNGTQVKHLRQVLDIVEACEEEPFQSILAEIFRVEAF